MCYTLVLYVITKVIYLIQSNLHYENRGEIKHQHIYQTSEAKTKLLGNNQKTIIVPQQKNEPNQSVSLWMM